MKKNTIVFAVLALTVITTFLSFKKKSAEKWQSKWVRQNADFSLTYLADEKGNTIPDFSNVGYMGGHIEIPNIKVVKILKAVENGSSEQLIQNAINEVAKLAPDANGFRGAILLKKGTYLIPGSILINTSGIVLRGEGNEKKATRIVASGTKKRALIEVAGTGKIKEISGTRVKIADDYVPVGAKSFSVTDAKKFKKGDSIVVFRPGKDNWINDLKMNQIIARAGTNQWDAKSYNLSFERVVTKIDGNKIFIDNPIVMSMEKKYGGGEVYRCTNNGRIENIGIENLFLESEFETDTSENHAWDAVLVDNAQQGWVRNVTAYYFGYSCVNFSDGSKNFTALNCYFIDPKSIITGGRRYSFNTTGQLNLFMNCNAENGRHDFVTGARVCGPNAFVNCTATKTHADIGPHHRWAMGTLYDNIVTDGEINVRDRGNSGSGHGWAGVNQVIWNCKAKSAIVENPWVTGYNWAIGVQGKKIKNKLGERPDGIWEGNNMPGLQPASLYAAQLQAKKIRK